MTNTKIGDLVGMLSSRWPEVFNAEFYSSANKFPTTNLLVEEALTIAQRACDLCSRCELCSNRLGKAVWADGNSSAKVFVVAEGPGQYEQRTLIPFTHTSEYRNSRCFLECGRHEICFPQNTVRNKQMLPNMGCEQTPEIFDSEKIPRTQLEVIEPFTVAHILNKAIDGSFVRNCWKATKNLLHEEVLLSELYITNIIKCRHYDISTGTNLPPDDKKHTSFCGVWLDLQLLLVQPEVLLLLGAPAAKHFLSKPSIKALSGVFKPIEEWDTKQGQVDPPFIPSSVRYIGTATHPSYIGRQSPEDQELETKKLANIFKSAKLAVGKEEKPWEKSIPIKYLLK